MDVGLGSTLRHMGLPKTCPQDSLLDVAFGNCLTHVAECWTTPRWATRRSVVSLGAGHNNGNQLHLAPQKPLSRAGKRKAVKGQMPLCSAVYWKGGGGSESLCWTQG